MYKPGTKLRFKDSSLDLTLTDAECITQSGSCGADEWLFHWEDNSGSRLVTMDDELENMLVDGATLIPSK